MTEVDTAALARRCWDQIKSNLEDRSVLQLGDVDRRTLHDLEDEQVIEIASAIMNGRRT